MMLIFQYDEWFAIWQAARDLVNPKASVKNNKTSFFIHDFPGISKLYYLKKREEKGGKEKFTHLQKIVYTKEEKDDSKCEFGKHHQHTHSKASKADIAGDFFFRGG